MTMGDLPGLLPLLVTALSALAVLVAAAFSRRPVVPFLIGLMGLAAALACVGLAWTRAPYGAGTLLSIDRFTLFAMALLLGATLFVMAGSRAYLAARGEERGEYYFLLLLSSLGACVLAGAAAFASFFLGLELLSVSLYALIAWRREGAGVEAGILYLILAGVSSAFLLFGMALIYAATGSMDLGSLAAAAGSGDPAAVLGLAMMAVGVGFKLAVVPFHMWTPEVYDGAPAPVAGYVATVSKGAMAVVLARVLAPALSGGGGGAAAWVLTAVAGLSMFVGNLLALREGNLKRLLAFSSIAHLGTLLVAVLAGGADALRAVAFYLCAYFATTLAAFASVAALSTKDRDADRPEDYAGLAARKPWLAGVLTAALLSLAGLPLTAGFVGKFVILSAGAGARFWTLAVLLAVNGAISIFYYLSVVSAMYRDPGPSETGRTAPVPFLSALALAVLVLAVVALGVYPAPLLSFLGSFTAAGF